MANREQLNLGPIALAFVIALASASQPLFAAPPDKAGLRAKIVRIIERHDLPEYSLLAVELTNEASSIQTQDLICNGMKDKTGPECFEPIWVTWTREAKVISREPSALQRTIVVDPRQKEELLLLVKRPAIGEYSVNIDLKPLERTANVAQPAGFHAKATLKVGAHGILILLH